MTLQEAIKHCEEVASECRNAECSLEHKQLANWLIELQAYQKYYGRLEEFSGGITMVEIEKRAKQWATDYPKTPDATYTNNDIEAIAENSFIQGAAEQKAIDIEKACEWLEMNVEYWLYDDGFFDVLAMLKDFRKAMEE